jgi:hypothetical protein
VVITAVGTVTDPGAAVTVHPMEARTPLFAETDAMVVVPALERLTVVPV